MGGLETVAYVAVATYLFGRCVRAVWRDPPRWLLRLRRKAFVDKNSN